MSPTYTEERPPPAFRAFSVACGAAAVVALSLSWRAFPPTLSVPVFVFAAAIIVTNSVDIFGGLAIGLDYPLSMAAMFFGGPAVGALTAALCAVDLREIDERPLATSLFNLAQLAIGCMAAGWTFVLLGGRLATTTLGSVAAAPAFVVSNLWPLIGACLVAAACNQLLVSIGIALARRVSWSQQTRPLLALLPSQIALGFVGALLASVVSIQALLGVLFVIPLIEAANQYRKYVARKSAFGDMVSSMVALLEAPVPSEKGRSARVAAYARDLGEALHLDQLQLEQLRFAALLQDMAGLSVPRETRGQTRTELAGVSSANVIGSIAALRSVAEVIRGSCDSQSALCCAESEPSCTQVLAVARFYDSLTTPKHAGPALARPAALEKLRTLSGSRFSPAVVEAFIANEVGVDSR